MTEIVKDNVTLIHGKLSSTAGGTEYVCCHVDGEPLVDQVDQFDKKTITVRYWVSNVPLETVEQATEQTLKQVMGLLDARIYHAWSECTGYLWTEEHLKIDGHNILSEIWETAQLERWSSPRTESFLLMEITVHENFDQSVD